MEDVLYTYEIFGMEILGAAFVVLLVLECIQLWRVHKLKERLYRLEGKQKIKSEMESSRRRDFERAAQGGNRYRMIESNSPEGQLKGVPTSVSDSGASGDDQNTQARKASSESKLISDVLGEIFP